jgi:hypothetical protein
MNDKNKTIDIMISLLEIVKTQPMFSISFYIIANTNEIEKYLIDHVTTTDWEGKQLSDDEIELNKQESLNHFYNSSLYNFNGESGLIFTKMFTVQDIKYDIINEIVTGKSKELPKNYKFIKIEKTNFERQDKEYIKKLNYENI